MSDEKTTSLTWTPLVENVDQDKHFLRSLVVCPRCGAVVPEALMDKHAAAHTFSAFAGF